MTSCYEPSCERFLGEGVLNAVRDPGVESTPDVHITDVANIFEPDQTRSPCLRLLATQKVAQRDSMAVFVPWGR